MHASKWGALLLLLWAQPVLSGAGTPSGEQDTTFRDFDELPLDSILDVKVTTAARHEQSLGSAPSAMTVITAGEIQAFGYETLADALRGLAGMQVSNDRNYEYLGIRGFAPPGDYNTRVLVLVDGHPMNDIVWSYAGIGTDQAVDLSLVDRIEVLRGPGSALYGTNAIFGTINVITKKPADLPGLTGSAGMGTFGRWKGFAAFGTKQDAPVRGVLSVSAMNSHGPDLYYPEFQSSDGGGWVRHLDGDRYQRFYAAAYRGPFTVRSLYASRTKGIPTAPWNGLVNDATTKSTDGLGFVDAILDRSPRKNIGLLTRVYAHFSTYQGGWPWSSEDSTGVAERVVDREKENALSGGAEGRLDWQPRPGHRILTGAEFRIDQYKARYFRMTPSEGLVETIIDRRKVSGFQSGYLQDEFNLSSRITSTIGCHYDHYPTFGGKLTPRAGLVVEPTPDTRLKALYGEGFKAPCYGEYLYYDGVTQLANPHLRPERYRSGELIVERSWGPFLWTRLSTHLGEVNDLIWLNEVDTNGVMQYQNSGRARLRGLELEVRGNLPRAIEIQGSLTRQEVRTVNPAGWAPNSPRLLANVGVHRRVLRNGGVVGIEMRYVGERRGVHEGVEIPAYLVSDANVLLPLPVAGWQAALKVRNLGDHRYSDPGGEEHPMAAIVQDGRTWQLSLTRSARPDEGARP